MVRPFCPEWRFDTVEASVDFAGIDTFVPGLNNRTRRVFVSGAWQGPIAESCDSLEMRGAWRRNTRDEIPRRTANSNWTYMKKRKSYGVLLSVPRRLTTRASTEA